MRVNHFRVRYPFKTERADAYNAMRGNKRELSATDILFFIRGSALETGRCVDVNE